MALDDDTGGSGGKAKTPKDEKRREQILVASALVGLVLTVLILRRSGSSAQAAALPVAATPVGNTGQSAGGSSGDFTSLANQVYGLSGGIATLLQTMQGQSSSPTAISHTTYNAQQVRDIFARFGDVTDTQIASDTFRASSESGGARVDRITRDLNSGARSIDEVTLSISQLPHSPSAGTVTGAMPRTGNPGYTSQR